jgi:hypothetical protein
MASASHNVFVAFARGAVNQADCWGFIRQEQEQVIAVHSNAIL